MFLRQNQSGHSLRWLLNWYRQRKEAEADDEWQ